MADITDNQAIFGDIVGTTVSLNGADVTASVSLEGRSGAGMFLAAGTLEATIDPEVSYDGGSTWTPSSFIFPLVGYAEDDIVVTDPNSATAGSILVFAGVTDVRVRVSSYTSGSADCTLRATVAESTPNVWRGNPGGDGVSNTGAWPAYNGHFGGPVFTFPLQFNGSTWDRARGDSTDGLLVNLGSNNDVSVSGTVTVDLGANNDVTATGNVAHDAADSGNPLKIGYKALAHGSNPTAVAAADRTDSYANRHGVPWVIGGHPNVVTIRANYTAAQTNAAIVTVGSGNVIVVTRCSVTVDNACSVDVQVRIGFAAATTPTTTGVVLSHPGIAAGSGVIEGSGAGILGVGGDGEDLRITSEVPTGGSIDVVVSYYTCES